jgi:hypothetical protein
LLEVGADISVHPFDSWRKAGSKAKRSGFLVKKSQEEISPLLTRLHAECLDFIREI